MTQFIRNLNIINVLEKKSLFLFGPRSVGKTTLVRQQLKNAVVFDLLNENTFSDLIRHPALLGEHGDKQKVVVVDEIQRLPKLLNQVHRLIESKGLRFLLTGSSARKLKRGAANLLGGRAWQAHLCPLVYPEIQNLDLLRYLQRGGLPYIYNSEDFVEEQNQYINLYIREEVQAEALTRNIEAFVRFLDTMGLSHGKEINFQDLSSDAGVPARTIENYISVLEDTLIGYKLPAFTGTKIRKAITRSKFYFFDVGIANHLAKRGQILPKSKDFGDAFEHFIVGEIRAYLLYNRKHDQLCYWRSTSQFEVDCIVGKKAAIEIKATELAIDKHLKGLRALKEEKLVQNFYLVSQDRQLRTTDDGILIYPWREFLESLWSGKIV